MDLKIGLTAVVILALWLVTIFHPIGFSITMGVSVWTWLSITAWYTIRLSDTSEVEIEPYLFEGDVV